MSLMNLFAKARGALARWRQRLRAYDELAWLDDRSLADIGVHRSQIPAVVDRLHEADQLNAARTAVSASGRRKTAGIPQNTPDRFGGSDPGFGRETAVLPLGVTQVVDGNWGIHAILKRRGSLGTRVNAPPPVQA